MFKFLVLSALIAVAAAAPHYAGVAHHEVPVVYESADVLTVESSGPEYAHIGSVVDHVPTAVSHQSRTDFHSKPVVKSVLADVEYIQPVVHHAQVVPVVQHEVPVVHHHETPVVYSVAPQVHSSSPLLYSSVHASPQLIYSSPQLYHSSPLVHQAW